MKRERILPCVNHPKAFWPWDKPYLVTSIDGYSYLYVDKVHCPVCDREKCRIDKEDYKARLRDGNTERANRAVRAWNTHAYGADDEA